MGMCSGVALLLGRRGQAAGGRFLFLHLGRVTTYGVLGAAAGTIGYSVGLVMTHSLPSHSMSGEMVQNELLSGFFRVQGALALFTAVLAIYMALALLGRLPSPELLFVGLTRRWGLIMRRITAVAPQQSSPPQKASVLKLYGMGMLWGALPCGLVMAALVTAAATGSPQKGALTMLAFGVGTWPVTMSISVITRLKSGDGQRWMRPQFHTLAALLVMVFGVQMALRGFAAWGWVAHYHVGSLMLW